MNIPRVPRSLGAFVLPARRPAKPLSTPRRLWAPLLGSLLLMGSCASTDPGLESHGDAPPGEAADAPADLPQATSGETDEAPETRLSTPLPEGWETCGALEFEALFDAWAASGPHVLSETERALLDRTLHPRDALSVRAVLLLVHTRHGHRALIEHLEERVPASTRALDAADVIAAAALRGESRDAVPERLATLARKGAPHPDIEVRVECARAALGTGDTSVVPFLLTVLRVGTHDEALDPPDWPASPTLAWIKSRAAEALSEHVGVPVAFRPDGSFEHQEQEARRLEGLLERRP